MLLLANLGFNSGEKTEAANNFLFYDNDTLPGNSGSPVIGRGDKDQEQGYNVKGIHVRAFNHVKTNGAQNIFLSSIIDLA